jgi:hypothetical protein
MSNTIQIISLTINAIELLVVMTQLCVEWGRGARDAGHAPLAYNNSLASGQLRHA